MQAQALFPSSAEFSAAQKFIALVMYTQDKKAAAVAGESSKPDKLYCVNYSVLFAMMYSGIFMEVCDAWGGGEGGGERGGGGHG